jgi:hypothetical protein
VVTDEPLMRNASPGLTPPSAQNISAKPVRIKVIQAISSSSRLIGPYNAMMRSRRS